jgi:AcrR family transcriptional regulator
MMFDHRQLNPELGSFENHFAHAALAVETVPRCDPRKRLLDAMIDTVAMRGYDRTTVSRVLSTAGLPEAVFTEHFRDKHDCFMQAVEATIGRVECATLELFGLDLEWQERVRLGLQMLLRALAEHPAAARVTLVDVLGAGPAASQRHRMALELFTSLVEEGRACSASTEHLPPQTSEAIVGGIFSILHRRVLQGDTGEQLERLLGDLTYFALLPYLDHERALAAAKLG